MSEHEAENRLLDIVVEEVSLVDRAANEHRFLIVKRDMNMNDDSEVSQAAPEVGEAAHVEGTSSPSDNQTAPSPEPILEFWPSEPSSDGDQLATIIQPIVEALSELKAVASQLVSETEENAPSKVPEAEASAPSDSASEATEAAEEKPQEVSIRDVLASIESLKEAVTALTPRLTRLEKHFGLPNSAEATGQVRKSEPRQVGWPMDLNHPMDRESVDKAVSFHDI